MGGSESSGGSGHVSADRRLMAQRTINASELKNRPKVVNIWVIERYLWTVENWQIHFNVFADPWIHSLDLRRDACKR